MDEKQDAEKLSKKTWRKRGLWIFILVNLAGIPLVLPLLSAVLPLMGVWWNTRSEASLSKHLEKTSRLAATASTPLSSQPAGLGTNSSAIPLASLNALTNNLNVIEKLKDEELGKIVSLQFGAKKPNPSDPAKFDRDSAIFHKISKAEAMIGGKRYFCYEVDLVDQNGNHKAHVDCFEKPDLDYERSMATLELVNNNPQLKKIYTAFAHVLGEQSSGTEKPPAATAPEKPAFRFEKDAP